MSEQQVERLQALLSTVQRNRQRPGQPIGAGSPGAAANVVQNKLPANMTAEPAAAKMPAAAETARIRNPMAAEPPTAPIAAPPKPGAGAPAPTVREQPTVGKPQPRVPEPMPSPVAAEAISPRVIEPDAPVGATRPIAQLVSKHAPVVDATFGAMLKRSLSLRPQ